MHGYSDFFEDVRNAFSNLINKKNPVVNLKSDPRFGNYAVELIFESSKLTLDLDRMDLQVNFVNPQGNKKYNVLKVASILHPNIDFRAKSNISFEGRLLIFEYLKYTDEVLEKFLMDVVEGNFTWTELYLKDEDEESQNIQEVLNLDPGNLTSQKFWDGDDSWKTDLKKFKDNYPNRS